MFVYAVQPHIAAERQATMPDQHAMTESKFGSSLYLRWRRCTHLHVCKVMHAVHPHIAARKKAAMPDLQQPFNGRKVRLAMQAVLLPVPVLLQGSRLNLLQQRGGHVGVLVNDLLPLCQLRQAGDGAHQVASVGLHQLVGVHCWVYIGACPPVQIYHCLNHQAIIA